MSSSTTRRNFVLGVTPVIGLATTGWIYKNELIRWSITHHESSQLSISPNPGPAAEVCAITPPQPEGPYHISAPSRRDVREGKPGIPLALEFHVHQGASCAAANDISIEIWHCDAAGEYSGHPKEFARKPWETIKRVGLADPHNTHIEPINGERFLRGSQVTDADGHASFLTIFPGWYDPRVPHIHIAVSKGGQRQFATQIYFDTAFANELYQSHPAYRDYGLCPYQLKTDPVLSSYPEATGLLVMPERVDGMFKARAVLVFQGDQAA